MSDPFEIRLQFTRMLQRLNASVNASKNCAAFALKHKDLDEDLHSCILEQLERSSMNNRVNLLYFIEHLLEMSVSKNVTNYVPMIQAKFRNIVDAVSPPDQTGLQNIGPTRKVLTKIKDQKLMSPEIYDELMQSLDDREKAGQQHQSDAEGEEEEEELEEVDQVPNGLSTTMVGKDPEYDSAPISPSAPAAAIPYSPTAVNTADVASVTTTPTVEPRRQFTSQQPVFKRPAKHVIEERMEEDRERHKRLRETIWAIHISRDDNKSADKSLDGLDALLGPEFETLWNDETEYEITEDDYELMAEEAAFKTESLS